MLPLKKKILNRTCAIQCEAMFVEEILLRVRTEPSNKVNVIHKQHYLFTLTDRTSLTKTIFMLASCINDKHFIIQTNTQIRGLLEKYPTFGREKETGLLGALNT